MPTVKIDINSGIESYPTDGIDSSVKLHNFTVGSDGSLYKLPVLKNLKTVEYQNVGTVEQNTKIVPYRICLLYTSPSPRDQRGSRMPSSA